MRQPNPVNNMGYLIQHVASLLSRQSEQVLQERLGIGFSQFKILRVLEANPDTKQREIARNLGQTEASVSRQVKLMIDQGLLMSVASPHNRRDHITVLTAKGERLTEAALDALTKYHMPTYELLSEKEQEQLRYIMEKIHARICPATHPNPITLETMITG